MKNKFVNFFICSGNLLNKRISSGSPKIRIINTCQVRKQLKRWTSKACFMEIRGGPLKPLKSLETIKEVRNN